MKLIPPKGSMGRIRLLLLLGSASIAFFMAQNFYFDAKSAEQAVGRPFYAPTHHDNSGLMCLMVLLPLLSSCFWEVWQKIKASEIRIRQLEERVEQLLGEKIERESASSQENKAVDGRYYSP